MPESPLLAPFGSLRAYLLGGLMPSRRNYYADLAERAIWTFAQGFCAFWIVTGNVDGPTLKAALVAGGLSVAKSLVSNQLPWTANDSASSLPESVDPPQEG